MPLDYMTGVILMKQHILAFIANYLFLSEEAANKYVKYIKHKEVPMFLLRIRFSCYSS